jgi:hypothetical protein
VPEVNTRQVGGEHYKAAGLQHWDWVIANNLGYLEGQITRYISRWRKKNGVQDLEKALHYAEKLEESDPNPRIYPVKKLVEVAAAYALTEDEVEVFGLVCGYQEHRDLVRIRVLIQTLIREARS